MANEQDLMEKIVSLAKRRGFIYPSSEIYGGINGFWDYGPLGVELKRNIKDAWWHDVVRCPAAGPDGQPIQMVGLDCSIIMNPKVWEASGHVVNFNDPLVDCKQCKARFRADHFWRGRLYPVEAIPDQVNIETLAEEGETSDEVKEPQQAVGDFLQDPDTDQEQRNRSVRLVLGSKRARIVTRPMVPLAAGQANFMLFVEDGDRKYRVESERTVARTGDRCPLCLGELTEPRKFNMMFKTSIGAMEDSSALAYLRPETAQGIFANYKNVLDTTRVKIP